MRKEIRDIFLQMNYLENITESGSLFTLKEVNKESFWFVSDMDIENVLEVQSELFEECIKITSDKGLKKNCNFLLLHRVEDQLSEIHRRMLLKLEEDPYHFRKYVLYYKQSEVDELKTLHEAQSLCSYVQVNMINKELFAQFKEKSDAYSGLALMYRILIKLPFLNFESDSSNGLENLEEIICDFIDEIDGTLLYEKFLDSFEEFSVKEIGEMEPEAILSLIKIGEG